jgi:hypothetical protein
MKNILKLVSEIRENIVVRLPAGTCAAQYSPAFLVANGFGDRSVGNYWGAPTLSITSDEYVKLMSAESAELEARPRANVSIEDPFETNQNDASKQDLFVQWCGGTVVLWADRTMKFQLTAMRAGDILVSRIRAYCVDTNRRCSQIHDGRIWL